MAGSTERVAALSHQDSSGFAAQGAAERISSIIAVSSPMARCRSSLTTVYAARSPGPAPPRPGPTRPGGRDVLRTVAAGGQALRLHFGRRRQQEDHRGVRALEQHLLGALHVDLEEHVGARRGVGDGRAHQVIEEFGPLVEATGDHGLLERGAVDEDVGLPFTFAGTGIPCRPAPAQPKAWILGDQFGRHRALSGPTWADEHEDAWFSAQSL